MTFLEALREAEQTGCLFFRPIPHDHQNIPMEILRRGNDERLGYPSKYVCALGGRGLHTSRSVEMFYWIASSTTRIGYAIIKGRWHRGGGGIYLRVEDYCSDDWVTVPLQPWFLFSERGVWNPLGVDGDEFRRRAVEAADHP